ncbi:MAG: hypothetical protein C0487_07370 [Leptothrix sp. (in: Bacteria)]|nr:hypothetical protein [Leptothrix sp. (in: b-proteobacteria)]
MRSYIGLLGSLFSACAMASPSAYLFGGSQPDGFAGQVLEIKLLDGSSIVASTSDSPIGSEANAENLGWWSDTLGHFANNYNYFAGHNDVLGNDVRNFFSFDLSGLTGQVVSATLKLTAYSASFPFSPLKYEIFDVSTSAEQLLAESAAPNVYIFNDLGSGNSYGTLLVNQNPNYSAELSIQLSSHAIADINARQGKYFSVGGVVTSVPEPHSGFMLMAGLIAIGIAGRKLRR